MDYCEPKMGQNQKSDLLNWLAVMNGKRKKLEHIISTFFPLSHETNGTSGGKQFCDLVKKEQLERQGTSRGTDEKMKIETVGPVGGIGGMVGMGGIKNVSPSVDVINEKIISVAVAHVFFGPSQASFIESVLSGIAFSFSIDEVEARKATATYTRVSLLDNAIAGVGSSLRCLKGYELTLDSVMHSLLGSGGMAHQCLMQKMIVTSMQKRRRERMVRDERKEGKGEKYRREDSGGMEEKERMQLQQELEDEINPLEMDINGHKWEPGTQEKTDLSSLKDDTAISWLTREGLPLLAKPLLDSIVLVLALVHPSVVCEEEEVLLETLDEIVEREQAKLMGYSVRGQRRLRAKVAQGYENMNRQDRNSRNSYLGSDCNNCDNGDNSDRSDSRYRGNSTGSNNSRRGTTGRGVGGRGGNMGEGAYNRGSGLKSAGGVGGVGGEIDMNWVDVEGEEGEDVDDEDQYRFQEIHEASCAAIRWLCLAHLMQLMVGDVTGGVGGVVESAGNGSSGGSGGRGSLSPAAVSNQSTAAGACASSSSSSSTSSFFPSATSHSSPSDIADNNFTSNTDTSNQSIFTQLPIQTLCSGFLSLIGRHLSLPKTVPRSDSGSSYERNQGTGGGEGREGGDGGGEGAGGRGGGGGGSRGVVRASSNSLLDDNALVGIVSRWCAFLRVVQHMLRICRPDMLRALREEGSLEGSAGGSLGGPTGSFSEKEVSGLLFCRCDLCTSIFLYRFSVINVTNRMIL